MVSATLLRTVTILVTNGSILIVLGLPIVGVESVDGNAVIVPVLESPVLPSTTATKTPIPVNPMDSVTQWTIVSFPATIGRGFSAQGLPIVPTNTNVAGNVENKTADWPNAPQMRSSVQRADIVSMMDPANRQMIA